MTQKLNLLKNALARLEDNREFMAYFLKRYRESENVSEDQLMSLLDCSADSYYKLAFCKAPDVDAPDFVQRLNVISQYTNILTDELNNVIKSVNSLMKFARRPSINVAMAARDKKKPADDRKK